MKIACSSATFARDIRDGELTQLDWLDLCANELEVDGVVFDGAHFPRVDGDYLAQLKKTATDLGLGVASFAMGAISSEAASAEALETARMLGAPVTIAYAPLADDDARTWGTFADVLKASAGIAKRLNVTLALRPAAGTLCASAADLRRIAKDVDSAWLRFAFDASLPPDPDDDRILPKAVIAMHAIADGDAGARDAIARFARFRGFVVLEGDAAATTRTAYHEAVARFCALRANALEASAR